MHERCKFGITQYTVRSAYLSVYVLLYKTQIGSQEEHLIFLARHFIYSVSPSTQELRSR
jgi:hypothetical protein